MARVELQPGFQVDFANSKADIAIGGGAVAAGKTFALVFIPMSFFDRPRFTFGFFRTTLRELTGPDSLLEETRRWYPRLGGRYNGVEYEWRFPSGAQGILGYCPRPGSAEKYKGRAFEYLAIDEISMFPESEFWYLTTRMRGMSGVSPFVRATTNPDPDSFVRQLIDWFINCDGFPDPDRVGKLRWFVTVGDEMFWSDDRIALEHTHRKKARSLTYIPGSVTENKALLSTNESYLTTLDNLPEAERMKLLLGNWDARRITGDYFQRHWFPVWDLGEQILQLSAPRAVRGWDLASSPFPGDQVAKDRSDHVKVPPKSNSDPDWTRGVRVELLSSGNPSSTDYCVTDMKSARDKPGAIMEWIRETAIVDGPNVTHVMQRDPGQAGDAQQEAYERMFRDIDRRLEVVRWVQTKAERANVASAAVQQRRVSILPGKWTENFYRELEAFPPEGAGHDDIADALAGAIIWAERQAKTSMAGEYDRLARPTAGLVRRFTSVPRGLRIPPGQRRKLF